MYHSYSLIESVATDNGMLIDAEMKRHNPELQQFRHVDRRLIALGIRLDPAVGEPRTRLGACT